MQLGTRIILAAMAVMDVGSQQDRLAVTDIDNVTQSKATNAADSAAVGDHFLSTRNTMTSRSFGSRSRGVASIV